MNSKNEDTDENLRCFLDGNCLCIVKKGFINLQESDAVFIELSDKEIESVQAFDELASTR